MTGNKRASIVTVVPFRRYCLLLLGLSLFVSCQSQEEENKPDPVIQIPLLEEASDAGWPEAAYQVKVLTPKPASLSPNNNRIAVAWSREGLLLWVDVEDSTPAEAEEIHSLWKADSLELFVASSPDSQEFIQLICAPGRMPEYSQPRWEYVDRQKAKPTLADPKIRVQNREGGYILSLLFPWSNLAKPPQEGDTIAVQLYINNIDSGVAKSRRIWAPSENNWAPSTYNAVRLSREAGPSRNALAWIQMENLSRLVIKTACSSEWAGQVVRVRTATSGWKKLGRIGPAQAGLVHSTFALPDGLELVPGQKLELKVSNQILPALAVPDLRALRKEVLRKTSVVANPSVFGTRAFPVVDFLAKDLAESGFGPLQIKVRWFNSVYEEVRDAAAEGRYGGLVSIETADGISDQRKLTVYRTPRSYISRTDTYETPLILPAAFGLPADIAKKEKGAVNEFMNSQLHTLAKVDADWAILLAGLNDLAANPRDLHGLTVWSLNADWWFGLEKKLGTAKSYENLVYLPKDYDSDKEKTWPLLLFLHGTGERGDDLGKVRGIGIPKLLEKGKEVPFITLAPQCPLEEWWNARRLDDLVDQVAKKYRVDPKRIYITGLSMGGFGAWDLAGHYPEKYAAAVPICGGALPDLGPRLKDMPIWVFHGDADSSVPLKSSQVIVDAIRKAGGRPKFTVYPGVGHESWTPAYDDPELYAWLLKQHR